MDSVAIAVVPCRRRYLRHRPAGHELGCIVYQLASRVDEHTTGRLFLEATSSTLPTSANLHLIRAFVSLLRLALENADIEPLRELAIVTERSGDAIHDLLGAARI